MRVVPVAFELKDAVDEVLEDARACDGAVLRHVADQDRRDPGLLRGSEEPRRRFAHLRHRPGSRADVRRVERLHGVDHADRRSLGLERREHRLELGLREDLDAFGAAEARRA